MPQISTTTAQAITGLPQTFATYRAYFNTGNKIMYVDVRNLVTIYNAFRDHRHNVNDVYYVAFGNKNPFPSSTLPDTTNFMAPRPATISAPVAAQGTKMLISVPNYYINRVMGITANHRHPIVDNWN